MNLILLLGICGGFASIGIAIYAYHRERKRFFESLLAFCNHLSVEIAFSKNPITQVIDRYGHIYSRPFQRVLADYKHLLDTKSDITHATLTPIMWTRLKPEEQSLLADFFASLGRHGASEELRKLANATETFQPLLNIANARLKKEAVIYLKLSIIVGIASIILLI